MVKRNLKKAIFACLLLIFISCDNQQENECSLDISGMEHFLKIAAILENDKEPAEEEWDVLFATPGYKVLTEGEFTREFFKKRFRVVFMPSMAHELEDALEKEKGQPFHMQHVHHYVQAKNNRQELEQFMDELMDNACIILEKAADKAKSYLPSMKDQDYIPVSFLIFANDARGYTPVVIDMLFAIELGDMMHVLIGHELHHYYRNKILVYDRQDIKDEDEDLIWVLDQIHCEGLADQIDKRKLISNKEGPLHFFSDQWEAMVESAPEYLNNMDKLLCKISDSSHKKEEIGLKLRRTLPMSGHPVGFYMANIIIEQKGKEELVEAAGNPFAFFRLYNKAAELNEGDLYCFSEEAMNVLAGLEAKYVK